MLKAVAGTASVVLGGREVGLLRFRAGGCTFTYTDDLRDPGHLVLGQVFEEEPRRIFAERTGLPSWFANLVPEQGSGLRRYYATRFEPKHIDDARLLLSLGADLIGAATVVPIDIPEYGVLVELVDARVDGQGLHLSAIPGAQRKMSLQRNGERLTLPARGKTGDWIVKLPDGTWPGLVENEYLMMTWATATGLDVPRVDLVPAAGVENIFGDRLAPEAPVYVVERFDRRPGGERVHVEDLAQVTRRLPDPGHRDTNATYDEIGLLVRTLTGEDGFAEYLRRLVAMVVMGNNDAHLKNWSLTYPDGRTPHLAPAYDLVCTTFYPELPDKLTFPLGGQGRAGAVGSGHLEGVALLAGYPTDAAREIIRDTAQRLHDSWPEARADARLPELVGHIDHRLAHHPLTRDC